MTTTLRASLFHRFLGLLVFFAFGHLWAEQLYTCGMHPQIIKKEPGDCPICGMALQPLRSDSAQGSAGSQITIDAVTIQRMNLKTDLVSLGPVQRSIRAPGMIEFNERGFRDLTLRFEAWVEKLHVNAAYARVNKGDPLLELYSPELYNALQNLRLARQSTDKTLAVVAFDRLLHLGLSTEEIEEALSQQNIPRLHTYRAPFSGIVMEKMVVEGQMMKPGERFFRLVSLENVWLVAQLYETDLPLVREGQSVEVRGLQNEGTAETVTGIVEQILPMVQMETRTASVRIRVENPDYHWRPGMIAEARFSALIRDKAVLVPDSAVLRSGERNTVFLALAGGRFEPRVVKLGQRSSDGRIEVLEGLKEAERIVVSGQFLLDSESQLRDAIEKMRSNEGVTPVAMTKEIPATSDKTPAAGLYTCPMEEDQEIVSDKPGRCPKCKMKLVPTSEVDHGKKSEEIWRSRQTGHTHQH